MFSSKINIFRLCKDFIDANCDSSLLRENENILKGFTTYLNKDENNNFIISDNEFSIKCIIEKNIINKFLGANETIDLENLNKFPVNINKYDLDLLINVNENNLISLNIVIFIREFDLAMETENSEIIGYNKALNINKNREIYDGLRKHLAKLSLLRCKSFYENTNILKATNFKEKRYSLADHNETPSDNSNKNSFELFEQMIDSTKVLLINENIEIPNSQGLLEFEDELNSIADLKPFCELRKQQEESERLLNADYISLFYKQPTQIKNINKNKLKANKEMENLMAVEDTQVNPIEEVKAENDTQLLNRKRKQSDGLTEIRKELIEKMPFELKTAIEKYNKLGGFNDELFEKYKFFKKYGTMNVKLLK